MKSLFTSLLATAAFITTVTAKADDTAMSDFIEAMDGMTTTTTSSTRLAEWGTAMATTASPTSTPSASPSSTPTLSPTKRTPNDKEEVLSLCKPTLLTSVSFDTNNSGGLSLHEFQSFIEDVTGNSFDNVALEGPIDTLYDYLRNACWTIFKMPTQCGEDTTTNDDEEEMIDKNGEIDMGKFPVKDPGAVYDPDGVLLTGFNKLDDKEKSKEEKKYELYFCEAMVTFYLMNDVPLDWTLVDGDVEETTTSSTEVAAAVVNASDTVGNWTIADVIDAVINATTNATDDDDDDASTNVTTATSSTAAAAIIVTPTTTTPEPTITTTVAPNDEEDPEVNTTTAEINIADNNGASSIVQVEPANQPASSAIIPLGGYVGMALGGVLLVFIIAALVVTRRRRKRAAAAAAAAANNSFDSIWVDEENNDMTNAGVAAEISSVAAMGVASTVATRLTTGDTEVTLMEKQAWTKREPVV